MKRCARCGSTERHKSGGCAPCSRKRTREWVAKNRQRTRDNALRWRRENPRGREAYDLQRLYGLSIQDWDTMLIAQAGRCGICSEPMTPPFVDHCHETKRVRELLCHLCNRGLGLFRDQPSRLLDAVEYLNRHQLHDL